MTVNGPRWAASAGAVILAVALVSTACGSASTPTAAETSASAATSASPSAAEEPTTVPAADVETAVVGQLDEPGPVTCPDDLIADVDQSVDCTLQLSDADAIQVKVTVSR